MKLIFAVAVFLNLGLLNSAWAFDRIYCEGILQGWLLSASERTQDAFLTPYNGSVTLTEGQSQRLVLLDLDARVVLTIFPWNSVYVRLAEEQRTNYSTSFNETTSGFVMDVIEKKTKKSRSLSCRFTF